jgi:hypothetical protein
VIKDLLEVLGQQLVFLDIQVTQEVKEIKEIKEIKAFKVM